MTVNELHAAWVAEPSSDNLNLLLASVRAQALRQGRAQHHPEAEDVAQDAALSVYEHIALYRPEASSFSSWIWTVTNGIIKDRRQKEARRPALTAPDHEGDQPFLPTANCLVLQLIEAGYSVVAISKRLNTTRSKVRCYLKKLQKQQPK